jgi:hypothetical protein
MGSIGRRRAPQVAAAPAGLGGAMTTGTATAAPGRQPSVLQPHSGPRRGRYLASTADTVLWGRLPNRDTPSALVVDSGSVVTVDTLSHEGVLDDQDRDPLAYFTATESSMWSGTGVRRWGRGGPCGARQRRHRPTYRTMITHRLPAPVGQRAGRAGRTRHGGARFHDTAGTGPRGQRGRARPHAGLRCHLPQAGGRRDLVADEAGGDRTAFAARSPPRHPRPPRWRRTVRRWPGHGRGRLERSRRPRPGEGEGQAKSGASSSAIS